jgi:hypothetical protein
VANCEARHVTCTCPREDQKDDKKAGWPPVVKKRNDDYVDPPRKPKK